MSYYDDTYEDDLNEEVNDDDEVYNFEDEDDDEFEGFDENAILEQASIELLIEYCENMSDEEFMEFCNSEECEILVEAGKFTKNTILSLNRNDELTKRTHKIALNIEARKNSALWKKYVKYRKLYLEAKGEIIRKNGSKASKLAKKQFKVFAKNVNIKRIPTAARVLDNKKK